MYLNKDTNIRIIIEGVFGKPIKKNEFHATKTLKTKSL